MDEYLQLMRLENRLINLRQVVGFRDPRKHIAEFYRGKQFNCFLKRIHPKFKKRKQNLPFRPCRCPQDVLNFLDARAVGPRGSVAGPVPGGPRYPQPPLQYPQNPYQKQTYFDSAKNQMYVYNVKVGQENRANPQKINKIFKKRRHKPVRVRKEKKDKSCQVLIENRPFSKGNPQQLPFEIPHFPDCPHRMGNVSKPQFCNLMNNHMHHTCCNHNNLHGRIPSIKNETEQEQYCSCHISNPKKKLNKISIPPLSESSSCCNGTVGYSSRNRKYEHKFERKTKGCNDFRRKEHKFEQTNVERKNENSNITSNTTVNGAPCSRLNDPVVEMALVPQEQSLDSDFTTTLPTPEALPPYTVGQTLNCIRCGDIVKSRAPRCYRCCTRIPPFLLELPQVLPPATFHGDQKTTTTTTKEGEEGKKGVDGIEENVKTTIEHKHENCTICDETNLIKLLADHQHPGEDPNRRQKREIYITRLTCDSGQCMKKKIEGKDNNKTGNEKSKDKRPVIKEQVCTGDKCLWVQYHQMEIEKTLKLNQERQIGRKQNEILQCSDDNLKVRSLSDSSLTFLSYYDKCKTDFYSNNSIENNYKSEQKKNIPKILQIDNVTRQRNLSEIDKKKYLIMKKTECSKQKAPINKKNIRNLFKFKKCKHSQSTERITTFDYDEYANPPRETIYTTVKKKMPPDWAKMIILPDCPLGYEEESYSEHSKEFITTFDVDDNVNPPTEIITTDLVCKQMKKSKNVNVDCDSSTPSTSRSVAQDKRSTCCETFTNTPSFWVNYKSNSFITKVFNKIKQIRFYESLSSVHKLKKPMETDINFYEKSKSNQNSNQSVAMPSKYMLHSESCFLKMESVKKYDFNQSIHERTELEKSTGPSLTESQLRQISEIILIGKSSPSNKLDDHNLELKESEEKHDDLKTNDSNDKIAIIRQIDWSECTAKQSSAINLNSSKTGNSEIKQETHDNQSKFNENMKNFEKKSNLLKDINKLRNPLIYTSEIDMRPLTCNEFFRKKCECKGKDRLGNELFTIELCPHGSSCNIKAIDVGEDYYRGTRWRNSMGFHCDDITRHDLKRCDKCSTNTVYCKPTACQYFPRYFPRAASSSAAGSPPFYTKKPSQSAFGSPPFRYPGRYSGQSSRYPGPSGNYPGSSSNYPGPSGNYPGPSSYYPSPSGNYPGPSSNYPRLSGNYPGPSSYYPGPSSRYPRPSNQYPGPATSNYQPPTSNYPGPSSVSPSQPSDNPAPSLRSSYPDPSSSYKGPSSSFTGPSSSFTGPSSRYTGPSSSYTGPSGNNYPTIPDGYPGQPGNYPGSFSDPSKNYPTPAYYPGPTDNNLNSTENPKRPTITFDTPEDKRNDPGPLNFSNPTKTPYKADPPNIQTSTPPTDYPGPSDINNELNFDQGTAEKLGWLYQTPLGPFGTGTLKRSKDIYFSQLNPQIALSLLDEYSLDPNQESEASKYTSARQPYDVNYLQNDPLPTNPVVDPTKSSQLGEGLQEEGLPEQEDIDQIFPGITQQLTSNVDVDLVPMLTKLLGIPYDERQPLPEEPKEEEKEKKKKEKHGCHKDDEDSDTSVCSCTEPCCNCGKLPLGGFPFERGFKLEDLTEKQLRELRILEGNIDSDLKELDNEINEKKNRSIDLKILVAREKLALLEEEKRLKVKRFGFADTPQSKPKDEELSLEAPTKSKFTHLKIKKSKKTGDNISDNASRLSSFASFRMKKRKTGDDDASIRTGSFQKKKLSLAPSVDDKTSRSIKIQDDKK